LGPDSLRGTRMPPLPFAGSSLPTSRWAREVITDHDVEEATVPPPPRRPPRLTRATTPEESPRLGDPSAPLLERRRGRRERARRMRARREHPPVQLGEEPGGGGPRLVGRSPPGEPDREGRRAGEGSAPLVLGVTEHAQPVGGGRGGVVGLGRGLDRPDPSFPRRPRAGLVVGRGEEGFPFDPRVIQEPVSRFGVSPAGGRAGDQAPQGLPKGTDDPDHPSVQTGAPRRHCPNSCST
jgi:hypothetical protein